MTDYSHLDALYGALGREEERLDAAKTERENGYGSGSGSGFGFGYGFGDGDGCGYGDGDGFGCGYGSGDAASHRNAKRLHSRKST